MLQKGFEADLSKQQISNVFANQESLRVENISPLTAIDTFSGARNGKIKAGLGKQNKAEAYYTRGR